MKLSTLTVRWLEQVGASLALEHIDDIHIGSGRIGRKVNLSSRVFLKEPLRSTCRQHSVMSNDDLKSVARRVCSVLRKHRLTFGSTYPGKRGVRRVGRPIEDLIRITDVAS